MNKEEQGENLYQILLKRNQTNADFIRRHMRKMQQLQKRKSLDPPLLIPLKTSLMIIEPILTQPLLEPLLLPQQPNIPMQLKVYHLSPSLLESKSLQTRFPSIKSSQLTQMTDKISKNQVCLPFSYPIDPGNSLCTKMYVSACFGDGESMFQKLYQAYDGNNGGTMKNRTEQSLEKQLSLNKKQIETLFEGKEISPKSGNTRRLNGSLVRNNIKQLISKASLTKTTQHKTSLSPQLEMRSVQPANSSPNKALLKMQDLVFSTIRRPKQKFKMNSKQNSSLITTYKSYKYSAIKNYDLHDNLAASGANSQSGSCKNIGNFPSISLSALSCANISVQRSIKVVKPKRKTLEERKVNLTEITSERSPELNIQNTKNFFVPFQQQFCHLKMKKQINFKQNQYLIKGNKNWKESNGFEVYD